MNDSVWAVIARQAAEHDEAVGQLARYRERARQAPVLFAQAGRIIAMLELRQLLSESLLRSVLGRLADGELPRAIAHEHLLVRRLAVGEKARRIRRGG